MENTETQG